MRAEAIFGPVGGLALWTMFVLVLTGFRRLRAGRAGRVTPETFRFGEAPDAPADVKVANRNLINLLELPLLFYVACLSFYVTHQVRPGVVGLAWAYVALRLLHSFIHLGPNRLRQRMIAFALSNAILVTLWIRFLLGLR
jgi:hypothetical protein